MFDHINTGLFYLLAFAVLLQSIAICILWGIIVRLSNRRPLPLPPDMDMAQSDFNKAADAFIVGIYEREQEFDNAINLVRKDKK